MPDIELKKIQPNRLNPRLEFTKAGLDELSDSIRQVGLLEPIIVRPYQGEYQVVVGERRYRAAQQAGLDTVPVIIRDYTDSEVIELNLIENIHREDLGAVEKGNVCKRLMENYPKRYPTQESLAKRVGIDARRIRDWLQLTTAPLEIQKMVAPVKVERRGMPEGKIDYATATSITRSVKEPERQVEIAEGLAQKRVPSRVAGQIIKKAVIEPQKDVREIIKEVVEEAPIFLPFSKVHADSILRNVKTQTTRKAKDPRLQKGVTVRAQVTHFADLEVEDVYRKRLCDFDNEDAEREGGYTLDEFKEVWKSLHGDWNPNESVNVIRFRLAKIVGEPGNSG